MESKLFHVGDVISVATYRVVSPRYTDGVNDILRFMTSESPLGHQVPRFLQECQSAILLQYPQFSLPAFSQAMMMLDEIVAAGVGVKEQIDEWLLAIMGGGFGIAGLPLCGQANDMLEVQKLSPHAHELIDPMSELVEIMPPDRIIHLHV